MLINAKYPGAELVHVRKPEQIRLGDGSADHPPGHGEAEGCLRHCPAGANDGIHELVPKPARGTGTARHLGSKNDSRSHSASSKYQRYLDQSTSTGPATGISRSRWKRRSFRREAMTPQLGQLVGLDDDLPPASGHGGGNDVIVGQVEEDDGSVGRDPGRLNQGSWSCSRLKCLDTLLPAGATGHFVFNDTNSPPHKP